MDKEEWRPVVGYEGFYEVSNLGNVWSCLKKKKLSPAKNFDGYLNICLYSNKQSKTMKVHRLVMFAFVGKPEVVKEVNHIDNVRDNNRLDNLEWVTRLENLAHTVKQNRHYKFKRRVGENHNQAKLTNKQVLEIVKLLKKGFLPKEVAFNYNVSTACVSDIKSGRKWSYITNIPKPLKGSDEATDRPED